MQGILCSCASPDCAVNGCWIARQYKRPILNPQPGYVTVSMPPSPMGCICPPTSEQTCMNPSCPRKHAASEPTDGPCNGE